MPTAEALQPAILYLGAGLAAAFASQAVRLSPIVGYLIAGVVIGPSGFGLVQENDTTHFLAELGVVFLLFDIGLHFSLKDIRTRRRDMLRFAPLQIGLAMLAFGAIGFGSGFGLEAALLVGASLALSSTAVVSRILSDRNLPGCPMGRSATAVLVAQDVAAIFLLVFAASLAGDPARRGYDMGVALVMAIASLGVAILAGRFVVRPLFRSLAATNNQEAFTVVALFIVLTAAAATERIGLSLTLGAFLAGMALSDTPYRHVVQHEVKPFQGLLLGMFFISVGMGVDLPGMIAVWPAVVATAIGIMAVKTITIFLAARLAKWGAPGATQLAFLLSQGSEFTLVIVGVPAVSAMIPGAWASVLVSAVAVTLVAAPLWTLLGLHLARLLAERAKAAAPATPGATSGELPVLVFGMTDEGRFAVDALRDHAIPYVALDSDPERFVSAASDGYDVIYGDARDQRLMERVGASRARAVVLGAPRFQFSANQSVIGVASSVGSPPRFIAVTDADERADHTARGARAHLTIAEPRGVELATDLLSQMGVDGPAIAAWLADQAERRGVFEAKPEADAEVA